jgi:hypothetical protein
MLPELLAMVGVQRHDHAVGEPGLAQSVEQAPDLRVGPGDFRVVQILEELAPLVVRLGAAQGVDVEQVRRKFAGGHAGEAPRPRVGRRVRQVRVHQVQEGEPVPVLLSPDPRQGVVHARVGAHGMAHPVVEAALQPRARLEEGRGVESRRGVARGAELLGERGNACRERRVVRGRIARVGPGGLAIERQPRAMRERSARREQARVARQRPWRVRQRAFPDDAARRQRVEVRRQAAAVAERTQAIGAQRVDRHHQHAAHGVAGLHRFAPDGFGEVHGVRQAAQGLELHHQCAAARGTQRRQPQPRGSGRRVHQRVLGHELPSEAHPSAQVHLLLRLDADVQLEDAAARLLQEQPRLRAPVPRVEVELERLARLGDRVRATAPPERSRGFAHARLQGGLERDALEGVHGGFVPAARRGKEDEQCGASRGSARADGGHGCGLVMVLANPRSRSGREDRAAAHVAAKRCRSPPVANRTRRGRGCREAKRDAAKRGK